MTTGRINQVSRAKAVHFSLRSCGSLARGVTELMKTRKSPVTPTAPKRRPMRNSTFTRWRGIRKAKGCYVQAQLSPLTLSTTSGHHSFNTAMLFHDATLRHSSDVAIQIPFRPYSLGAGIVLKIRTLRQIQLAWARLLERIPVILAPG